jgi:hypothetical protein
MARSVSLWEVFAEVADPRDSQGRRYPLPAVSTLAVVNQRRCALTASSCTTHPRGTRSVSSGRGIFPA